jgi:hypothetical protein
VAAASDERADRHDHMAWFMWHLAALFRHGGKKLPDIALFMTKANKPKDGNKKPVDGINEDAIMAWLVASQMKTKEKEKAKK